MAADSSHSPSKIETVLEQWFEIQARGEEPDLDKICGYDAALTARARSLIERQDRMLGKAPAAMPTSRPPLPTDRLGEFELKARIGSGGMGDVYLARQSSLGRDVAIKLLRSEFADDPLRRLRFKREAQLTAALDHANIVPVYGTGEEQGHVFLVMKLLPGQPLDQKKNIAPRELAALGAQAARALHAAHQVGIVHRDVKPGNIQIDGSHAWVLDFGLARGRVDLTLTTEGQVPGTLAYMPPEQLRDGDTAPGPLGDVYSLGATLYYCIAGRPPFDDASPQVLIRSALLHEPEALSLSGSERDLNTLVLKALEKDPSRRFDSALEMAEELERFASGHAIQSRPPSTLTRMVKLARRHRVVTAAASTGLLLSALFGARIWRDSVRAAEELTQRFDRIATLVDDSQPAAALARTNELAKMPQAAADARLEDSRWLVDSALALQRTLDRIQLDAPSLYQRTTSNRELSQQLASMHPRIRTSPEATVATCFAAWYSQADDKLAAALAELQSAAAYPRLHATFASLRSGDEPQRPAPGPASSATDHVFTGALLLAADVPLAEVSGEWAEAQRIGPTEFRTRLMTASSYELRGELDLAAAALQMLWDPQSPRPELHCFIARLAAARGQPATAEQHFDLAERALNRLGRTPILRLDAGRIEHWVEQSEIKKARSLLAAARSRFGTSPMLDLSEARINLHERNYAAARRLLAAFVARFPKGRANRRAEAALLHIEIESFCGTAWQETESIEAAERLRERATAISKLAELANDTRNAATGYVLRFKVEEHVRLAYEEAGNRERFTHWDRRAGDSLGQALLADDLHAEATCQTCARIASRLLDRKNKATRKRRAPLPLDLKLGDATQQARRRAVRITIETYEQGLSLHRQFELACMASYLSAMVNDRKEALRNGAIASWLLDQGTVPEGAVVMQFWLNEAGKELRLNEWPEPPRRSR
ncbi:MAG: serine/threonine-protein kinase [Planctomycetota bacterium]